MVATGVWLSVAGCLAFLLYYALTPDGPVRGVLVGLAVASLAASLVLAAVPVKRLRWRGSFEPFFVAWSVALLIDIAAGVVIDGGASSPLAIALFLPLAFAAMGYRLSSTLVVGGLAELAYLLIALTGDRPPLGEAVFFATTIAIAAGVCAWQAHNQERQREELARLSRTDPLTGCLNRRGFEERFEAAISDARRSGSSLTLVLVDLDGFKEVNDTRGHVAGDRLLCWVAEALARGGRAGDAAGRLGGDEFAVLLTNHRGTADQAVERLQAALAARAPACLGAARYPTDGETLEELHRTADGRLYAAKGRREARAPSPGAAAGGKASRAVRSAAEDAIA